MRYLLEVLEEIQNREFALSAPDIAHFDFCVIYNIEHFIDIDEELVMHYIASTSYFLYKHIHVVYLKWYADIFEPWFSSKSIYSSQIFSDVR